MRMDLLSRLRRLTSVQGSVGEYLSGNAGSPRGSSPGSTGGHSGPLTLRNKEELTRRRLEQFELFERSQQRGKRINSVLSSLLSFLKASHPPYLNQATGGPILELISCDPQVITAYLASRDTDSSGRTMCHDKKCKFFGEDPRIYDTPCDFVRHNCGRRLAAESLRTGVVSKLISGFDQLGLTGVYDPVTARGNPARAPKVPSVTVRGFPYVSHFPHVSHSKASL